MTMFSAQATIKADDIDGCLPVLLEHMEEHATVIHTGKGAMLVSPFGSVEIRRQSEDLFLEAKSASVEVLSMMKVFIAEHVFEFAGETASIVWSDDQAFEQTPPHFQKLTVMDTFNVTPRMRRVRFSCERVTAFTGDVGYHVRLLLPPRGKEPVWPSMTVDGRLTWPDGNNTLVSRVYTIRDVDMGRGMVEIDFVLHDAPGPASIWAVNAQPGDIVGMLGPSGGRFAPADCYLIAGDETALPAISRLLGDLPAHCRGVVFIEIQDEFEIQQISHPDNIDVHWLLRRSAHAGTTTLLQDAVLAFAKPFAQEPYFAWISCEFTACNAIRAHLRENWAAPKGSYLATSYWRRGSGDAETFHMEGHDEH
jgi:NADPH-dependent ferric siderophore reductase